MHSRIDSDEENPKKIARVERLLRDAMLATFNIVLAAKKLPQMPISSLHFKICVAAVLSRKYETLFELIVAKFTALLFVVT